MAEPEQAAPTMSSEEAVAYRKELEEELAGLKVAQEKRYSKYKADRIKRLSQRIGVPVD